MLRITRIAIPVLVAGLLLTLPAGAQDGRDAQAPLADLLPADGMTHEQMADVLRALEAGEGDPPACVAGEEMFDDVPASHPFCPWVEELAQRGVTSGCDADSFCPGDAVSRAQMATFVVKAVKGAPESVAVHDDIVNNVFLDLTGAGDGVMVPGNGWVEYGNVLDPDTGEEVGKIATQVQLLEVRDAEASDFDFYLDCTITLAGGAVEFGGAGSTAGILDGSGEPFSIRGGTGNYEGARGTASIVFDADAQRHLISIEFSG